MYPTTLSDAISDIFIRLNESEAAPAYWTAADILRSFNEGLQDLAEGAGWDEQAVDVQFMENRVYYDLRTVLQGSDFSYNERFLWPTRCFNFQTNRWLEPCVVLDLDLHTYRRWEQVNGNGQPERFFMRGGWWLGLWPRVSADYDPATDTGKAVLYFMAAPAYLSATDSLPPALLEEFKSGLISYVQSDMHAQQGEVEKAQYHWTAYEASSAAFYQYASQVADLASTRLMGRS